MATTRIKDLFLDAGAPASDDYLPLDGVTNGTRCILASYFLTTASLTGVTNFSLKDTSAAYDVTLAASSTVPLTANATLRFDLNNVSRILHLTGDATLNQDVSTAGSPTFVNLTTTGYVASGGNVSTGAASGFYLGSNLLATFTSNVTRVFGGSSGLVIQDNTGAIQRVVVDSVGNVGIGAAPISFGAGYTTLDVYNATNGGYILARSSTTTGQFSATSTLDVGTRTASNMRMIYNNSVVGTWTATGLNSTAIGATTPSTGAFTALSATGALSGVNATFTGTLGASGVATFGSNVTLPTGAIQAPTNEFRLFGLAGCSLTLGANAAAGVVTVNTNGSVSFTGAVSIGGTTNIGSATLGSYEAAIKGSNLVLSLQSNAASSILQMFGSTGDTWRVATGVATAGDFGIANETRAITALTFTGGTTTPSATFIGAVFSNNPTAGIGYSTGAGGTVTQATSKGTTVTLNKICGTITMNNAALGAGSVALFGFLNSNIATTDTMTLGLVGASFATAGTYRADCQIISGGAYIWLTNISGGSLSEAVQINFTVHKSVNS